MALATAAGEPFPNERITECTMPAHDHPSDVLECPIVSRDRWACFPLQLTWTVITVAINPGPSSSFTVITDTIFIRLPVKTRFPEPLFFWPFRASSSILVIITVIIIIMHLYTAITKHAVPTFFPKFPECIKKSPTLPRINPKK
jgi:hypothetical protein